MSGGSDHKRLARLAVYNAIRSGRLVRPMACACTGCPGHEGPCLFGADNGHRIEAHHPDHDQALVVVWLCNRCHKIADSHTFMIQALIERASRLRKQGHSLDQIAKRLNVSIRTIRKHVK